MGQKRRTVIRMQGSQIDRRGALESEAVHVRTDVLQVDRGPAKCGGSAWLAAMAASG